MESRVTVQIEITQDTWTVSVHGLPDATNPVSHDVKRFSFAFGTRRESNIHGELEAFPELAELIAGLDFTDIANELEVIDD